MSVLSAPYVVPHSSEERDDMVIFGVVPITKLGNASTRGIPCKANWDRTKMHYSLHRRKQIIVFSKSENANRVCLPQLWKTTAFAVVFLCFLTLKSWEFQNTNFMAALWNSTLAIALSKMRVKPIQTHKTPSCVCSFWDKKVMGEFLEKRYEEIFIISKR